MATEAADREPKTTDEADFVIVGAGSAGCVLANRLTESGRHRVAVLEAGGSDRSPWVRMPIGYGKAFYHDGLNWKYVTEPVPGANGRRLYWPRGKVLGGSSSINAMVFIRGQAEDYEAWAALGNRGWSYRDVLPLFKRMEDNSNGVDAWRAVGGPIATKDVSDSVHPLCATFLAACAELGLPQNPDFNGESQEGVGIYQITTRNGFRCSAAAGYLRPAMKRPNLRVETETLVARVLFEGRRAVGVEYWKDGALQRMRARREVILSAGAVNSPQILQLSGVGAAELLREHGIDVVQSAAAVGQNLQDHADIDHLYESKVPTLNNLLRPWWGRLLVGLRYILTRQGPLSLSVNQAGGFIRSDDDRARPNLQLYFSPVSYTKAPPGKRALMSPDPFPGLLMGISNCRPTSRGYLQIRSASPFDPPEIHPNYLATDDDVAELVQGARVMRRIAATQAMRRIVAREIKPGPEVYSDEALIEDIRARSGTVFHPCGTCAMGPSPKTSVVDPRLRVHGVDALRVVDASIFPLIPSGNTNAASMMVGEKGADLILEDAG